MLIDRTHKLWFVVSAVIGMIAGASYFVLSNAMPHGVTGGSVAGLLFGIVGSAMMVFAALLAVRKRLPTWRVGSAQWWLRGHLWLGTLGFVLILFHSGFGWGGLLESLLWISFGLVVVTGFAGVALQHVIPRLLTTRVPLETMVAQIPFLSQTNLFRADELVAKQAGPLDIPFEPLKPFAEEVLKQQRVLKRESDFPKELAKVYANVPQPEADAKKAHAAPDAAATVAKPSPLAQMKAAAKPADPTPAQIPAAESAPAATESALPVKPKSPLELMREKAAAKAAAESAATPPASVVTSPGDAVAATKPLSPLEQMKAKMTAKKKAADAPVADNAAAASPVEPSSPTETAPAAKLSPLEIMKAKMAAKKSEADAGASVPVGNAGSDSSATAADENASGGATLPTKPLSPLEMMKSKLAAQKGSSADKPADAPKPLMIDKSDETKPVGEQTAAPTSDKPAAPPPVKKPMPMTKPPVAATPSVASAPPKSKPFVVIPSAALAELRDFHLRAVRPFLDNGRSASSGLNDVLAARRLFGQLKADLPAELHETLDQLEAWCEERRQWNTQLRLHRWLHWWLVLHIPPSIALLALFVAHVIVSLRVVPFAKN